MRRGRQPVFRIFVSSTFADLKAERNILQERVFPRLQQLCERHSCRFQAIDLRWGVSEEAALDQQTMNICLTELRRCQDVSPRPNFIILLGDRYGWLPLPPQIEAGEFEAIISQLDPEDQALLKWDEGLDDGGGGWYRLDTNAVPPEYILRPRREVVPSEKDYDSWGETEQTLRLLLLKGVGRLGWPEDDVRRVKYERSATHQEITEGALKLPDDREHVFAFLRDIGNPEDLPEGSEYIDDGYVQAQTLKDAIRDTKGVSSISYEADWSGDELRMDIRRFAADVLRSLKRIIREELRQIEKIDDLTRENLAHEEFGEERCRHFVGRQKILDDIAAYLLGELQSPLVVYGPSGSGKSALMAKAVLNVESKDTSAHIIRRFIGATPESTDIRTLLRNLCLEISGAFGFESLRERELAGVSDPETRDAIEKKYGVPDEYRHLVERYREFLRMIPEERHLMLFLDALDQLGAANNVHSLNWLPSPLPGNVKIVVSVLERDDDAGECLRSAKLRFPESALLRLEEMSAEEGREALDRLLVDAYPEKKRTLAPEQMASILSRFSRCPTPLYLKLAFEEARRWKSFEGLPTGADQIPGLAYNVPGIVDDLLGRLKDRRQHGEVLVSTFLGLLSASRHGLSETEILELLSADDKVMTDLGARSARSPEANGVPTVIWLRLYHDLAPYLMERSADNTVLYNFYHRVVGETISLSYVNPAKHKTLAEYFRQKADPNGDSTWTGNHVHALAELPYQQRKSESMWVELEKTLTDLYFIEAKCKAGIVYDLVRDYGEAEWAWPGEEIERQKEEDRQERIKVFVYGLIEHAKDPDRNPLPEPPPLIPIRLAEPESDEKRDWTWLECVQAWKHFVSTHVKQLSDGEEPIFQIAWNSVGSGPVAERMVILEDQGKAPSQEWLRLRNRPAFALRPACPRVLEGHTERVNSVSVTPDGRRAVSGSLDETLRVWDLATGACLQVLEGHTNGVTFVSTTSDGRRAVSGSLDGMLRVWDLATGICLQVLRGHMGGIPSVSITPDGRRAVSGSWDGMLRVWDLATGICLRVLEGHTERVNSVSVTPDGRRAVSGSLDETLRVWDLATGACLQVLEGHTLSIESVALTPDGRRAVSGSWDKTLRVWDLATGACLQVLERHTNRVDSVSITPDGRRAVSGSWDETLRVWDLATGTCLQVLEGNISMGKPVSITPDGRRAVSGSWDKKIRVWDLATGACLLVLEGHSGSVTFASSTPDGQRAVSERWDKKIRVWDLATGSCLQVLEGHTGNVTFVSYTPDGRRAVSGSRDNTIRVWDLATGACLQVLEGHTLSVDSVSITPDGRRAVSGSWDKTLRVWDLATGACLRVLEGHTLSVDSVSITPDGRRAVSGSRDNTIRVWDLATGACLQVLEGHTSSVDSVSITPDGRRAVSGSWDNTLRLWDLTGLKCVFTCMIEDGYASLGVAHSALVVGTNRGSLRLFTIENYRPGTPALTALRLWRFDTGKYDAALTAVCPWCGERFVVQDAWISKEIACPNDACRNPLKLDPFVCDNSDWLK